MAEIITIRNTQYEVWDCIVCGVVFTVPKIAADHRRQGGGFFQCTNGHGQGWRKDGSEIERIRRERDRLAQQIAQRDDELLAERRAREAAEQARVNAERDTAKEKAARKKVENRVHNGVCPDCNRTFFNLQRHMASKHKITCNVAPLKAAS